MRSPPRRDQNLVPERNEPRVNERIRVPRVLVVDEEGAKLGEFLTEDALALQFPFQDAERLVNIIVANDNLHGMPFG